MATCRPQNEGAAAPAEHNAMAETTPLLTPSSSVSPIARECQPQGVTATSNGWRHPGKPLPVAQVLLLCFARTLGMIAWSQHMPYINQMVRQNGHIAEADMGFYSGLIESLSALSQMTVMFAWGRAADRFGRKPALVCSLVGIAICTALFGMAKTIWQMVIFRCAAGFFAGNALMVRTMLSEHSTNQTQATLFSWLSVSVYLGTLTAPLIGGSLSDPAKQYPTRFGGIQFFEKYPYALPSFAAALISLTAAVTTVLFVEETLHRDSKRDDERGSSRLPRPSSTWELLKAPGVGVVLYNYGHAWTIVYSNAAVTPVFWATGVGLGGLGLNPFHLSLFLSLAGFSQAIWLLLVFPPLQRRIGTRGVMRISSIAYPFYFVSMPALNALLRWNSGGKHITAFWILSSLVIATGMSASMSSTASQLAIIDVSRSYEAVGTLNAIAMTVQTGSRAFSPVLVSSLFAVGVRNQFLYGYFGWVFMILLALAYTVSLRFMPARHEKTVVEQNGEDVSS